MITITPVENPKGTWSCDLDITVEEWKEILSDKEITSKNYKEALMAFYNEPEHKATCGYLGLKYYKDSAAASKYNSWISSFGEAIVKRFNRFHIMENGEERFWHVAMRSGTYVQNRRFEWTMRNELVQAIEELGWNKRFTWIPFYMEMADKLLEFKDNRQPLVDIVYGSGAADYITGKGGVKANDVDPFSVYAIFNRKSSDETRFEIANYFKTALGIKADVPDDFTGIPVVNNLKASFFYRENIDISIQPLWDFFEVAITGDKERFIPYFDVVRKQRGIRWNITMGLFWIRPYDYLPLDSNSRTYLPKLGIDLFGEKQLTGENYVKLLDDIKQKIEHQELQEKDFPEISYNAWLESKASKYWLVGYSFGGNNSQLERFVKDGIWEARFNESAPNDEKLLDLAEGIKVGDILILKSSSTKGTNHDQAFMRVKGIGVATEPVTISKEDDMSVCTCKVEYKSLEEKDFDGSAYGAFRKTIHEVDKNKLKDLVKYVDDILAGEIVKKSIYQRYINLLKANHNLVLTGAPGTGKTHMAREIAKDMTDGEGGVEFVQFHPSYDYTDFVEGLRPVDGGNGQIGFERRDGVFKAFCRKAILDAENPYIFIIDEINRGEASKIFGELFFAIDPGYRGCDDLMVQTQYQNLVPDDDVFAEGFYVPENVYIIGTMNDIDRSVESMDFAMRRRFTWLEIKPEDTQDSVLAELGDSLAAEAKAKMERLNATISATDGLGAAYQIGAAYFKDLKDNNGDFGQLWSLHLEPLLREYLRGMRKAEETIVKFKGAYDGTSADSVQE